MKEGRDLKNRRSEKEWCECDSKYGALRLYPFSRTTKNRRRHQDDIDPESQGGGEGE